MREIEEWLQQLGLAQYTQRFVDNGIDLDVLADLTDQDLETLGIVLGHRRKLLRAIADLGATEPAAPAGVGGATPQDGAERRQLTVMFCDLVGSTALATRFDPEDMRAVIRAYQDCCAAVVARYDGFIAQFLGDGVMVYFGYPRAHEDDAERAVRAGLDMVVAVDRLQTPVAARLQIHVGIATGLVVVGDLIGQGSARERAVVGDTPHLAARLQGLAAPGAVVVAASTRHLLGDGFTLRPLGSIAAKGFAEPVAAWSVAGVLSAESRFEAARVGRLTSFVGREREVALLDERCRLAWHGHGQIVLVSGEAGIGKSRFVAQFAERVAGQPHTRLRHQCSPYHTTSALYPVIEHLKRAAEINEDDPPAAQLDKLEAMLAVAAPEVARAAPLVADLLSIPSCGRYPSLKLSAAQQRRQTLATLLDQFEGLARLQPVLFLFEDVHWADATSIELLDLMVERIRRLPVLALITHRPEFDPAWIGLADVSRIALGRLDRQQVNTMIGWLTADKALPREVTEQIFAKTDGVPLFVEELTKAVLESRVLVEEAGRYRVDGKLLPLAIPTTLHDSLMARLDRLAPVREIAQVAAAIGREFSYTLLNAVAKCPTAALDSALEQLEAAELLFRSGPPPQLRYRFKHALVRDAAYESLLKSRRQVLHRQIAETLRDQFPAVAAAEPEVIAQHFAAAGLTEAAVAWWSTAGEQASRRSAYVEASAHYRDAIALADTLPDTPDLRRRRIRLLIAYGEVLHTARSPGARETMEAFARARELAGGIEQVAERHQVVLGLWTSSVVRADLGLMQELASAFMADVERCPTSAEAGLAHRFAGVVSWMAGDLTSGRIHLEAAVAAYRAEPDARVGFQLDLDPGAGAMLQLALTLWLLGEADRARALGIEGLALAIRSGRTPTVMYGYTWKCTLDVIGGEVAPAMANAEMLMRLGREYDLPFWSAIGTFFHGWARWRAADTTVDLAEMQQTAEFFVDHGLTWYAILVRVLLAVPQAAAGDVETALITLDGALTDIERTGLRWLQSEAYRQRAEILAGRHPADRPGAEADYRRAISVARSQQARSFELRAALGLGSLYCATGRSQAAHDLLAPILAILKQESGLAEIEQAQHLLATAGSAAWSQKASRHLTL